MRSPVMGKALLTNCCFCNTEFLGEWGYLPGLTAPYMSKICPACASRLEKNAAETIREHDTRYRNSK